MPRTSVGTRIKLDVIAAAAHVSTPTVSKVLNGRPDVAPQTRRHIENVLREFGYVHEPPRPRRVGLIDLVFNDLAPWAMEIIRGAQDAALAGRTRLAVSTIPTEAAAGRWLRSLDRSRTDGVVLVLTDLAPEHRERLAELQAPVILVDPVAERTVLAERTVRAVRMLLGADGRAAHAAPRPRAAERRAS